MALTNTRVPYAGVALNAMGTPTTTETVDVSGGDCVMMVTIGATPTVVTVVVPGNDPYGTANPDQASASLSSTTRGWRIPQTARDPLTNLVTVTFSQVSGVTATVLR